jgi:hypothetical protein
MIRFIVLFFVFIPSIAYSQIKIDKGGNFWDLRVSEALQKIKFIDSNYYKTVNDYCQEISFWNGPYSTNSGDSLIRGTIIISAKDMNIEDLDNICAVIVHESLHLKLRSLRMSCSENEEEVFCYQYERDFLLKVPGVKSYLIRHAELQIKYRSN